MQRADSTQRGALDDSRHIDRSVRRQAAAPVCGSVCLCDCRHVCSCGVICVVAGGGGGILSGCTWITRARPVSPAGKTGSCDTTNELTVRARG